MCDEEPLVQGDLDEYCGQYALINAIRWLKPEIGEEEFRSLFAELLARMTEFRKGKRSARVTYGVSNDELECSGSMIPDTDLGGTVATEGEVFNGKTASFVFN